MKIADRGPDRCVLSYLVLNRSVSPSQRAAVHSNRHDRYRHRNRSTKDSQYKHLSRFERHRSQTRYSKCSIATIDTSQAMSSLRGADQALTLSMSLFRRDSCQHVLKNTCFVLTIVKSFVLTTQDLVLTPFLALMLMNCYTIYPLSHVTEHIRPGLCHRFDMTYGSTTYGNQDRISSGVFLHFLSVF